MKKIGVLIVEDSAVVRQLLEHIIGGDPRLEIVAVATSAEEALEILQHISPDIISLDIRLPGMNGFEATRRIMRDKPTPIVVCSASVEAEDLKITMTALRAGALAVVEKPVGTTRDDYERIARTLCTQLAIMSEVKVVRQRGFTAAASRTSRKDVQRHTARSSARETHGTPLRVLGIGASTGGPNAVVQVLTDLGPRFPLPVLLVQHMMPSFLAGFASWLESVTPFRAVIARNGEIVVSGTVYLAPPDYHLQLEADRIRLTQDPPASLQRPSATVMFQSMARTLGDSGLGILLTGMGDDGADGLLELRRAGGYTVAEHESTAVVYGMPRAAVDRGAACDCLPLNDIAPRIRELVSAALEV
jgi:two-component system, chemotaxis family, protein-glutamate methylesterase/glutaminase